MIRVMLNLYVEQTGLEPFFGSLEVLAVGEVFVSIVNSTPADYFRSAGLLRDGRDALFAVLPRSGSVYTTQGGDVQRIEPGQLAICDSTEVGGLRIGAETEYVAVQMPRARLASLVPHIKSFGGLLSRPGDPNVRFLAGYLASVEAEGAAASAGAAKLLGQHLIDLVALVLGGNREQLHLVETGSARAARRQAIFREIDARLNDPQLSARSVARALSISPRYIHHLFEDVGCSFSRYVLDKRLDQVGQRLRDPTQDKAAIFALAYGAGFIDLSHFNRGFRARFGMTPSEYKQSFRR